MIADYLLKIFRAAIPHMPKTATGFGQDLQLALQPMILKPSAGLNVGIIGLLWYHPAQPLVQGLQETVACMCAVVQCLTRDFLRLVNLLKSCNGTIIVISPCFDLTFRRTTPEVCRQTREHTAIVCG